MMKKDFPIEKMKVQREILNPNMKTYSLLQDS